MAQILPKGVDEQSPDHLKLNADELEGQRPVTANRSQRQDHVDDSNNGHHGKNSVLHKFKDKAKRLKDKVKKNITGHHESSGEEEESEKEQEDSPQESDENAEAVRRALAGLGTFETRDILNKHDMSSEEATKANEKQELQARRDDVSTEETMKGNKVRDILNSKDDVSKEKTMKANEDPNEKLFHYKETEEGRGNTGNAILISEKEEIETDVGIPSLREKAGEAMAEATETMLGLGKGRQQQGGGEEEKPMSSRVKDNVMEAVASVEDHFGAKPEKAERQKSRGARSSEEVGPVEEKRGRFGAPIGPNSAENSEEESQSLAPKTQDKVSERGQGNGPATNEIPPNFTEEIKAGASELGSRVMSKASELVQGFKDVVASDQSSKDKEEETLIEGECKANRGKGTQEQQSGAEVTGGQSYAQKLYAAKDAIASSLGYGGKENNFAGGEKLYAAKDAIASKLGYGGNENNFVEQGEQIQGGYNGTGTEAMEGAKEKQETFKGVIVSKLSPGEDEKALSEVITEAFNHGAKSVKDSVLGGFYGCNGNPNVSSSSTSDGIVDAFHDNDCQNSGNNPLREKGMTDSVTGVVSSLPGRIHGEDGDRYPSSDEPEPKSVAGRPETTVIGLKSGMNMESIQPPTSSDGQSWKSM